LSREKDFIHPLGKSLEKTSKFFFLVFATYIELEEKGMI